MSPKEKIHCQVTDVTVMSPGLSQLGHGDRFTQEDHAANGWWVWREKWLYNVKGKGFYSQPD